VLSNRTPSLGSRPAIASLAIGRIVVGAVLGAAVLSTSSAEAASPPPPNGYFTLVPEGSWSSLPGDAACANRVHQSEWEPRPENDRANHHLVNPDYVRRSFDIRPRAVEGAYAPRWDSWLLPRVDGQFTGTTDEIFQWAACKWGLPDNLLRGIAVRESTWYNFLHYSSGEPYPNRGSGDIMPSASAASSAYCDGLSSSGGVDYQQWYGEGICPKTFSIVGIMAWQDPAWGKYPGNQNGTFPFSRNSTAFSVDYIGAELRGCFEGWETWLDGGVGGDIWGCVGGWYAGAWHSPAADRYISRVKEAIDDYTWGQPSWMEPQYACDPVEGCPV
jgi:hypothetical protein